MNRKFGGKRCRGGRFAGVGDGQADLALTGGGIPIESRVGQICHGAWLSLVERLVRDQEVASSNLVAPTKNTDKIAGFLELPRLTRFAALCRRYGQKECSQQSK